MAPVEVENESLLDSQHAGSQSARWRDLYRKSERPGRAAEEYMNVIAQVESRTPKRMPLGALRFNIGKVLMDIDQLDLCSASSPKQSSCRAQFGLRFVERMKSRKNFLSPKFADY